ncbi:MAG: hypothetical protein LAT84_12610 [Balneolia bacterium]|nr:hypothetical protein [Balneolia bacterium]
MKLSRVLKLLLSLLIPFILIAGCGLVGAEKDSVESLIAYTLTTDMPEVDPGERFLATYTAKNLSNKKLEIETKCRGFATISVFQNEEMIHFNGAFPGCFTSMGYYEIGPGESISYDWEIGAYLLSREDPGAPFDTTFAAPGSYTLSVTNNVVGINGESVNPATESITLIVK